MTDSPMANLERVRAAQAVALNDVALDGQLSHRHHEDPLASGETGRGVIAVVMDVAVPDRGMHRVATGGLWIRPVHDYPVVAVSDLETVHDNPRRPQNDAVLVRRVWDHARLVPCKRN